MLRHEVDVDDLVREPASAEPGVVGLEGLGYVRKDFAKAQPEPCRRISGLDPVGDGNDGELEETSAVAA